MGAEDAYTAYCIDEAAAWLVAQKDPPDYGGEKKDKPALNNSATLAALEKLGGVRIKKGG